VNSHRASGSLLPASNFTSPKTHIMRTHIRRTGWLAGAFIFLAAFANAQEQAAPSQQQAPAGPESSSKPSSPARKRSHSDDFLLRGTVFTPEGLAFPGAELRIRRASEKKFRWSDVTNSRGDFAIRVKMGSDYEVVVHAKGYQDQSQTVSASTSDRFKDLVFRMQPGGKKS
jgi:Carboxypeptidase regulatory-like domain